MTEKDTRRMKVRCPYCGAAQKVQYTPEAICRGLFIKCAARQCRQEFEIRIKPEEQVVPCVDALDSINERGEDTWLKTNRA